MESDKVLNDILSCDGRFWGKANRGGQSLFSEDTMPALALTIGIGQNQHDHCNGARGIDILAVQQLAASTRTTMSALLPEILEQIFLELPNETVHEKATLGSCSFVCRSLLPSARSRLLHTVHLYQNGVDRFLQLCDHPLETISGHIRKFSIYQNLYVEGEPESRRLQNSPALNRLLTWRSSDGQRTLSTVLSQTSTLDLAWIGWWTLSKEAEKTLLEDFQSVRELGLWMAGFDTYGELSALINSFRALESLSLETIRPFRKDRLVESFAATGPWTLPSTLQSISLKDVEDAELIKTLIPCPSLRSFKCHYVNFGDFTLERAAAIGTLLSGAGHSLEEFSFTIQAAARLNEGTVLGMS
ncbi:hypothetical protein MPER_09918 [Moniliophthora perniciosa FA553]|nr:hypothetical protein MPER_09918 [Moniliophthora perniciosa FA553]